MYLFGASGHGKVVAEIAISNNIELKGFIDKDNTKKECLGFSVFNEIPNNENKLIISIGNNKIRKEVADKFSDEQFTILIHSKATISPSAELKTGTVVMAGATINAETEIGKHCIINTNASIDHDCMIEDFVHISPNVALAGNVEVGEGTHIGIGASVIQGINIGKWATVGAGAVIINDVPDFATVVGNPGKIIKIKTEENEL